MFLPAVGENTGLDDLLYDEGRLDKDARYKRLLVECIGRRTPSEPSANISRPRLSPSNDIGTSAVTRARGDLTTGE